MAKVVELPRATHMSIIDSKELLNGKPPPAVDPETALPESLLAYVVQQDPKMTVFPEFFSEEECDHLIQLTDGYWMPSLVGGAEQKKKTEDQKPVDEQAQKLIENTVSQTRTSWSCMLRYAQTDVIERLEHRLASINGLAHGVAQLERMNMVRYAPGETFREHHDGKFRPITIFVYLNDLPDDDEGGDTFFPVLGNSFRPRRGTAVMWANTEDGTIEDSRMTHAGRPPFKGVKYGVNCFTNEKCMRDLVQSSGKIPLEQSVVQRLEDLVEGPPAMGDNGKPILQLYIVFKDPEIKAIPGMLTETEVEKILEFAEGKNREFQGAFQKGTQTIAQLPFACNTTVEDLENCICAVTGQHIDHLSALRIVRPGLKEGLCNRGCGKHSVYICLGDSDEIYFPRLGVRFPMKRGDALTWTNVNFDTGVAREEMRTMRVHVVPEGGKEPIGIDAYFHDNALRAQQKLRTFIKDSDVLGPGRTYKDITPVFPEGAEGYKAAAVPKAN